VLTCEVPVKAGRPLETGDYAIPGVPGTGAPIQVDLAATAGAATGRLLPTGNPVDRMEVEGLGTIEVSYVDIGNAHVFLRARDLGLTGTETAAEIDANGPLRETLERIRAQAGVAMGMYPDAAKATAESPATPFVAMIAPPQDYQDVIGGRTVRAAESDFLSRLMFMQQMHKTYAGTSTVCTGIAAKIPGTLVHEAARPETQERVEVRIGHPAGVIVTQSVVALVGNDYEARRATVGRTARRILEGTVYVP